LTLFLLVGIALVWAAVLGIPVLRSRGQASGDSISDFNYRLDVLGRTNGNITRATRRASGYGPSPAARRRRAVLLLSSAVTLTGLVALATGKPAAWLLNIVADVAFATFLALWAWARSVQVEQSEKVHELPEIRRQPELALRRAASS
jgi:hypothetical protein